MRVSGDIALVLGLFVVLISITIFVLPHLRNENDSNEIPYSTYSTRPDGTRALYTLLDKLGYRVTRIQDSHYVLDEIEMLLLLQPLSFNMLSLNVAREIDNWVKLGNTLIVANMGAGEELSELLEVYESKFVEVDIPLTESNGLLRIFKNPPVPTIVSKTKWAVSSHKQDAIPLFGREDNHSVVSFKSGFGRVFLLSCPYIFTNDGLSQQNNAKFLYNLLTYLSEYAKVGFDEYHHGTSKMTGNGYERPSVMRMLLSSPIGWALAYAAILVFVFLILHGRRLGKPIVTEESARRLSSEYVIAMATLYQQGKKGTAILQHIKNEFRRRLAAKWDITPHSSARDFVSRGTMHRTPTLAQRRNFDVSELEALLNELDDVESPLTEERLLTLAQQVEEYKLKRGQPSERSE